MSDDVTRLAGLIIQHAGEPIPVWATDLAEFLASHGVGFPPDSYCPACAAVGNAMLKVREARGTGGMQYDALNLTIKDVAESHVCYRGPSPDPSDD
jgi:hypothetical protein